MSSKPPRFTTAPPACTGPPECAIRMWSQLHDPASIEGERHIRADERRLLLREMQPTLKDLDWILDNLDKPDAIDKLRRHVRRLITLTERRAA